MKITVPVGQDGKIPKTGESKVTCAMCETANLIKTKVAGVPAWACMRCGSTFYRLKDQ